METRDMKNKLPELIFVYQCDEVEDGTAVYAVVLDVDELPEDAAGLKIGTYQLTDKATLHIKRELIKDQHHD